MQINEFRDKLNEIDSMESEWCLVIKFTLPSDSENADDVFKAIESELEISSDSADIDDLNSLDVTMKFNFNSKDEADKVAREKFDVLNDHVDNLSVKVVGKESESEEEISEGSMEDKDCNGTEAGKYCPVHGMKECTEMNNKKVIEKKLKENDIPLGGGFMEKWKKYSTSELEKMRPSMSIDDQEEINSVIKSRTDNVRSVKESKFRMTPELSALMKKYGINPGNSEINESESGFEMTPELAGLMKEYGITPKMPVEGGLEENTSINFSMDGPDAESFISRILQLSGSSNEDFSLDSMKCDVCGQEFDVCQCNAVPQEDVVVSEPEYAFEENIDNDYGHVDHPEAGEPVDTDEYMYKAPNGPQRITKGMMGDNSLIKEYHNKMKYDYKKYLAEADMVSSNAGSQSPFTATDRDDFVKDPFSGDEPVDDGTISPFSRIKTQSVNK